MMIKNVSRYRQGLSTRTTTRGTHLRMDVVAMVRHVFLPKRGVRNNAPEVVYVGERLTVRPLSLRPICSFKQTERCDSDGAHAQ
jgi:hypothetical protein